MDILDILIAKKKSFTGETEKLTRQANEAMAKANEVTTMISSAEDLLAAAQAANEAASSAASSLESMSSTISSAASDAAEAKSIANNAVAAVITEDNNNSAAKIKKIKVTKNGANTSYDVVKNYTTIGQNEDGSMTQKAITNALASQKTELENKIRNTNGGNGSGNISGNLSSEDEGHIVAVGENGDIIASSITEEDIVKNQIISGTYHNNQIVGLEIDYQNKTFTRLQGAVGLSAGNDFNRFKMYGGRKRCVVDASGNILEFITESTDVSQLQGQRIMVYQPLFYYLRVPISMIGNKVNKEHIYISEQYFAGFKPHPAFLDEEGNILQFILLPAFESAAVRANGELVTNDAQDINFDTDHIISTINIKPISGYTQDLNINNARKLCTNNGTGWHMTNLSFESINQMLIMIEYGTMNIQSVFNKGIVDIDNSTTNNACITGSTYDLYNTSGRAATTINNRDGVNTTYNIDGRCAISYRGMENPYGGMWRFIDGLYVSENNNISSFAYCYMPAITGWINRFAYYNDIDWAYLPIEAGEGANSSLPVGDYVLGGSSSYVIIGGSYAAGSNAGPFYYQYLNNTENTHFYNDSARIMFIPEFHSNVELNNYTIWYNFMSTIN